MYPVFVYSWIPITFLGFLHRHERVWSHTQHTRALSYQDMLMKANDEFANEPVFSKQAAK